ncbi:unnamed protein product [Oikopleura dioica]|uniref:DML1/Misato tubulin domain-containing protein n=2 Tax=Oikopleura dioica TaxID=34765 RepID=E4XH16_OIKDI|nr:unnamed protein product [Oikopleura dioica]
MPGAGLAPKIDSDYSRLHAVPNQNSSFQDEKEATKASLNDRTDEELVESQIENWDGGVEVHRSQTVKTGWSSKWNKSWTQFRYPSLVTLPELHNASPPELTSYTAGFERMSENKYMEQVEDAVRVMAEESDRVEGFVYLADCFDGFAGGIEKVIEMNLDDYHRRSLLFNFEDPENQKSTPFSLVSKALTLQSQADLIVPLWSPQSNTTEEQSSGLSSVISNVMYLLEGIHISAVQHQLSPFSRQKIVQTMSLNARGSINEMMKMKPQDVERNLHWMDWKSIAHPSYKPRKSFQPRSIVNVCLGQVTKSQYSNSLENDLSLWYNRHLRCAAQSVVMPSSESIVDTASLISLRTTNAIHEYLACLLQRVKKFPCKLSGFEDDDWAEKVENLATLRDQTSPTDGFSSDSD